MIILIYFFMVFLEILFSSFNILNNIDFAFIFVFIISFYYSLNIALFFSFFVGLFIDFYYSFPIGVHSLIYVSISYLIGLIKANIDFDFIFSRFFNFIIFNLFVKVAAYIISNIAGWKISWQFSYLISPFLSFVFFEFIRFFMLKMGILKYKFYGNN